ncbi:MAG: hypothetical protein ACTHLH_08340 [Solirubrobacterales bacterium]
MRISHRQVALSEALNRRGLGTLLFDLVETTDSADVERDVAVLTGRLIGATRWSERQWGVDGLPTGYVGSGLGSAAALRAAAVLIPRVSAIVSHGGRPDLAGGAIAKVKAPTLLLADAGDATEVRAARAAAAYLPSPHRVHRICAGRGQPGGWAATPSICRWMEWHLADSQLLAQRRSR